MKNYLDAHCHLDLLPSMLDVSNEALRQNVNILAVTTTPKAYIQEREFFKSNPNIKLALGLHPQLVSERCHEVSLVENYFDSTNFIGEIGLDFSAPYYSSKQIQIDVFEKITKLCSHSSGKILSIHSVRSDKIVLDIIEKSCCHKMNTCILHWYSGSVRQLQRAVDMGCYFSINTKMVHTPNGRQLISIIPNNKLLLETDAPFISNINNISSIIDFLQQTLLGIQEIKQEDIFQHILSNNNTILNR